MGAIRPTSTSLVCAPMSMAAQSAVASNQCSARCCANLMILPMMILPVGLNRLNLLHAEIRLAYPVVAFEFVMTAFEYDTARLKHVTTIRIMQRFRHALFHQQHGKTGAGMDGKDAFENFIRRCRREAHGGLVQ